MDKNSTELKTLHNYFERLFPICRSIAGQGLRDSFKIMQELIPLTIHGVESGTKVFDWTVPEEWNIKSAWLKGPDGKIYADFSKNNLAIINYSEPIHKKIDKKDLLPHLHTLPNFPSAIPYVTSYYKKNWGFCLDHNTYSKLPDGEYEVFIDSNFSKGQVIVGDYVLTGENREEVFLSSYLCHPSMANNELSGPLVLALLYMRMLKWKKRRYSYRFVINPETIGSLCYLYLKSDELKAKMKSGLILTCMGGKNSTLSYKQTRSGKSSLDELVNYLSGTFREREFTPFGGSDERQFNSPGFKLPVGQMARDIYGEYDFYHTSLDNLEFMGFDSLIDSVDRLENLLKLHELSGTFINLAPYGEPQLGKRGLYPNVNSPGLWNNPSDAISYQSQALKNIIFILNYSDGEHSMLTIAKKLNVPLVSLEDIINRLEEEKLLQIKP